MHGSNECRVASIDDWSTRSTYADPDIQCSGQEGNVFGHDHYSEGVAEGVQANVWVASDPCGRETSVFIEHDTMNNVEMGWMSPKITCVPPPPCVGTWWFREHKLNGQAHLDETSPNSVGTQTWTFIKVQDSNQDSIWSFYWDGQLVGSWDHELQARSRPH